MNQEFSDLGFDQLVNEMLTKSFKEDRIEKIGSYWDKNNEIDILAKTKAGKIVAGICKYSKSKAKKSELTKLKEQCAKADLEPDIFVIFSKSGFSNELKKEKGEGLRLFALKNLNSLIQNLAPSALIDNQNKKY